LLKTKRTIVSSFLEEHEKKQKVPLYGSAFGNPARRNLKKREMPPINFLITANSLRNLTLTMDTASHNPNHAALQKTRRAGWRDKRFVHRFHSLAAEISYPSRNKAVIVLVQHVR
jgi:hypothetical protein